MDKAESDEQGRLDALKSYAILDTPPENDFDSLTRLVAQICEVPIATVTLVDERRQWFKSAVGLNMAETDRAIALCAHAIRGKSLFLVPDTQKSPLFERNPLVTGEPGIRFYAGMPLISTDGFALGTLAVIDRVPRTLTDAQIGALHTLARQVMVLLELRRQRHIFENSTNKSVERFTHLAKATTDALWDWDLKSDSIWWSEGFETLFGVCPHELGPGSDSWTSRIHPDDKERVLQGIYMVIDAQDESWTEEYRFLRNDGSYAHVRDRGFVIRDDEGNAVRMIGGMTDHTARKRSELERDKLHKEKMLLLESTGEGIWGIDIAGRCTFVNGAAARMLKYDVQEMLGKNMHELTHHRYADGTRYPIEQCPIFQASQTGRSCRNDDEVFWRKDGTSFPAEYASYPIVDGGSIVGSVVTFSDITERNKAKLEIMRINRALQMRSACSELLIRATDETELLTKVCRLALDIGGYRMAWVGYANDDEVCSITPVAHAGNEHDVDFINGIKISWSDDQPTGLGPGGETIRKGVPVVLEDISQAPSFAPWLVNVQKHGYRGLICLPLRDKKQAFGLFSLYSDEVRPIPSEEIKLLQALADDLAFGIGNLRAQSERRRILSAVSKVVAGVSAGSGKKFFEQLARYMAESVGAHAAFIARLSPGEPCTTRTVVALLDGTAVNNFDSIIESMPCEMLFQDGRYVVHTGGTEQFHGAPLLSAFNAQAYVGGRLDNSDGQAVGLLFVLFRERLKQSDLIISTLQIFAARAAAELERQEADARIRHQASLLDKAQDAIMVRGMDHRVLFWNKSAERLYGWTSEEAVGSLIEELLHDDRTAYAKATGQVMELGEWTGEITQRRKDGSVFLVEGRWTLVKDEHDQAQSILAINTDITERKAAENKIRHLAFYDPLTRLPNRQLLLDRLQHALAISSRTQSIGALLFIDLDNFKTLNDTLGHEKGDQLLQQVASRLVACVRTSDTVARLGGDEFLVMLEDLSQNPCEAAAHARDIGGKILAALNQPYVLDDHGYFSTPSIGVTLLNAQHANVGEVLKHADLAMYQAKAAGRNTLRFFDPEMQTAVITRAALEADLREGLENNEFILYYQPQVNGEGYPTGAEALLRWRHPRRGLVSPAEFIPLAEETGLIQPLGQWVLETACTQLVMWAEYPETTDLTMAVNVSSRQFRHPEFVAQILAVLDRTGAAPHQLKLELTEGMLIDNLEDTIAKMIALKAHGVGFSLDDFGTGYSSLAYLKRLPLVQLKIDRSFVKDVLTDANDATIARTIITLGQSLGLTVIAEGVETEAQRDFLARHNCDAYQGYLFSRPLPAEQFEAFIQARARVPAYNE
jgi:diguanylate cyclase (GGDEF)-like protein/PAS domain S-box-containing protein